MIGEPLFLRLDEALQIHADMIATYGGSEGVRDQGLLESALAQPQARFGGGYLHEDFAAMAAAYLFHIAQNHPFVDGNKRTGTAAAITFLKMNGVVFRAEQMEVADLAERIADGRWSKQDAIAFFQKHAEESP